MQTVVWAPDIVWSLIFTNDFLTIYHQCPEMHSDHIIHLGKIWRSVQRYEFFKLACKCQMTNAMGRFITNHCSHE